MFLHYTAIFQYNIAASFYAVFSMYITIVFICVTTCEIFAEYSFCYNEIKINIFINYINDYRNDGASLCNEFL